MTSWHSYPKIYNIGHAALIGFFEGVVTIEEKIDGSQFSFGKFNGELKCRSKGKELVLDAPEKMFTKAVDMVKNLEPLLIDGYTYRGEYLQSPKHNALAYDRYPNQHVIIFDINSGEEQYLSYKDKKAEAARLGLETVPLIFEGVINSAEQVLSLVDRVSILGGQKIEGLVIKNPSKFGTDKKVLMAKHVTEAFKEVHKNNWKKEHPKGKDTLMLISEQYRSKARWNKAIQHLKESGILTGTPQDIANLIKEVQKDIQNECAVEIKEQLFAWAQPHIMRTAIKGLPEWYKDILVSNQFSKEEDNT